MGSQLVLSFAPTHFRRLAFGSSNRQLVNLGDTAGTEESWKNLEHFLRPAERWPTLIEADGRTTKRSRQTPPPSVAGPSSVDVTVSG